MFQPLERWREHTEPKRGADAPILQVRAPTDPLGVLPWRADIQALRALAIILVMLHHAGAPITGGFLGVDIFFVISGFLMTQLICRELNAGKFSFTAFWRRRARRLLPSAYATVVVVLAIGFMLLDPHELHDLFAQAFGTFTFTANIVLWRQITYFNNAAELKPLLHMWSLGVEEQYYLLLPVLLFFTPKQFRLAVLVTMTGLSAVMCAYFVSRNQSAAFYLTPFRAWELGLGSIVALLPRVHDAGRAIKALRIATAVLLVTAPFFFDERGHPGLGAWIVTVCTGIVLFTGSTQFRAGVLAPLIPIGDRSYSLYLTHWPTFAFAHNIYLSSLPPALDVALVLVCLVWTELQYRLVERPFRRMQLDSVRSLITLAVIPAFALCVSAAILVATNAGPDARRPNQGFSPACDFRAAFVASSVCANSSQPHTLVWGDSHAMHLISGMAPVMTGGIRQATKSTCGPFLDIAPIDGALRTRTWAQDCIAFNRSVLNYLRDHSEISTVVLSSSLAQYVAGAEPKWTALVRVNSSLVEQPQNDAALIASLARTVAAVRAMGKRVLLVAPPPSPGVDTARCVERRRLGLAVASSDQSCDYSVTLYERANAPVLRFLAEVRRHGVVDVVSFDPYVCQSGLCRASIDRVSLLSDTNHLSAAGSRLLIERMNFPALIRLHAR